MPEIRELLDMRLLFGESCQEVRELVEAKIDALDKRTREIREMRRLLAGWRRRAEAARRKKRARPSGRSRIPRN